jgi:hypothetical protein
MMRDWRALLLVLTAVHCYCCPLLLYTVVRKGLVKRTAALAHHDDDYVVLLHPTTVDC